VLLPVDKLQQQFGAVVRRKRLAAGLSQEALSEEAGLHRTYVGLLERGLRMPSILVAKKVAEALGITMSDLLGEVEQEPVSGRRSWQTAILSTHFANSHIPLIPLWLNDYCPRFTALKPPTGQQLPTDTTIVCNK